MADPTLEDALKQEAPAVSEADVDRLWDEAPEAPKQGAVDSLWDAAPAAPADPARAQRDELRKHDPNFPSEESLRDDFFKALFGNLVRSSKPPSEAVEREFASVKFAKEKGLDPQFVRDNLEALYPSWLLSSKDPARWQQDNPEVADLIFRNPELFRTAVEDDDLNIFFKRIRDAKDVVVTGATALVLKGQGIVAEGAGTLAQILEDISPVVGRDRGLNKEFTADFQGLGQEVNQTLQNASEQIREVALSRTARLAFQNSQIGGKWNEPDTWTFGENPSLLGLGLFGTEVLGQMAPVLLGAVLTGGAGGVAAGVLQSAGGASQAAREKIDEWEAEGTLAEHSAYFRNLMSEGYTNDAAVELTRRAAARLSALSAAPVGALGGAGISYALHPASALFAGGVGRQIAGRILFSHVEQSISNVAEDYAGQAGRNLGAGAPLSLQLGEGTFGTLVGSALAAGPTGFAGAVRGIQAEMAQATRSLAHIEALQQLLQSQTARLAPEAVAKLAAEGEVTHVYAQAEVVQKALAEHSLEAEKALGPELAKELAHAAETGERVALPVELILNQEALPDAAARQILEHGATDPDAPTAAETKAFSAELEAEAKRIREGQTKTSEAEPISEYEKRVAGALEARLRENPKYKKKDAQAQVDLFRAMIRTMAARTGQSPDVLFQGLDVELSHGKADQAPEGALQQTETPDQLFQRLLAEERGKVPLEPGNPPEEITAWQDEAARLREDGRKDLARKAEKVFKRKAKEHHAAQREQLAQDRARTRTDAEIARQAEGTAAEAKTRQARFEREAAANLKTAMLLEQEGRAGEATPFWDRYDAILMDELGHSNAAPVPEAIKAHLDRVDPARPKKGLLDRVFGQPKGDTGIPLGNTLYQKDATATRGFMRRTGRLMEIVLNPSADFSTFLHESAHVFLEMYADVAERHPLPDGGADLQTILEWTGYGSLEQMRAAQQEAAAISAKPVRTLEEQARLQELNAPHEKFARGFEAYLMEGRAPSTGLRSAFSKFHAWLTGVYKNVRNLGVELNDEIRGTMDRMLATDEEIAAAQLSSGDAYRFFETFPELAGEDFQRLKELQVKATSKAQLRANRKLLKERLRENEDHWKRLLNEKMDAARTAYRKLPAHRAKRFLLGYIVDPATGLDGSERGPAKRPTFDRAKLVAALGEDRAGKLETKAKGGLDPDTFAQGYGFKDAKSLFAAIDRLPSEDTFVQAQTGPAPKESAKAVKDRQEPLRQQALEDYRKLPSRRAKEFLAGRITDDDGNPATKTKNPPKLNRAEVEKLLGKTRGKKLAAHLSDTGISPKDFAADFGAEDAKAFLREVADLPSQKKWARSRAEQQDTLAQSNARLEASAKARAKYREKPEVRAREALRGTREPIPEGVRSESITLDRAAVEEMVGPEAAHNFRTRKEGGVHPDDVAALFDYETGRQMLEDIYLLPDEKTWAKASAEAEMKAEHPGLLEDRARLQDEVQQGLHNRDMARYTLEQMKLFWRLERNPEGGTSLTGKPLMVRKPGIYLLAQERAARDLVADTTLGKLSSAKALTAERKAGENAFKAALRKNFAQATAYLETKLLNQYRYTHAVEAVKAKDRFLRLARNLSKNSVRAEIGKGSAENLLVRRAVDTVLAGLELRKARGDEAPITHDELRQVAELVKDRGGSLVGYDTLGEILSGNKTWKDLTVAEMQLVDGALRTLRRTSERTNRTLVGSEWVDADQAAANFIAELEGRKKRAPIDDSETAGAKLKKWFKDFGMSLDRQETVAEIMGGVNNTESAAFLTLVEPLMRGHYREQELLAAVVKPVWDAFQKVPKKVRRGGQTAIDGARLFPGANPLFTPPKTLSQLILLVFNSGNEGNTSRTLDGRGVSKEEIQAAVNEYLDKPTMDWIQSVWDAADALYPLDRQVEERINGVAPEKVIATPFETAFGTYRGGYFPLRYVVEGEIQSTSGSLANFLARDFIPPGTPSSSQKSRAVKHDAVINLDVSGIARGLRHVAHSIAMREAVLSVANFLQHPEVHRAITERVGAQATTNLLQWVKDVGRMQVIGEGNHAEAMNRAMRYLKRKHVDSILKMKLPVAASDVANMMLPVTAGEITFTGLVSATNTMMRDPAKAREIVGKLGALQDLRRSVMDEYQLQIDRLGRNKITAGGPVAAFLDMGYGMYEATTAMFAGPVGLAAYEHARDQGKTEEQAKTYANHVVRKSFSSKALINTAPILRDQGFTGTSAMFMGFTNGVGYQRLRLALEPIIEAEGIKGRAQALYRAKGQLIGWMLFYQHFAELIMGRGPELSDGDTELERWGVWFARKAAMAAPSTIHGASELASAIEGYAFGKRTNFRASPLADLGSRLIRDLNKAKNADEADKAFLAYYDALALLTGAPTYPVAGPGAHLLDVASGEDDLRAKGLIYGPEKGQR